MEKTMLSVQEVADRWGMSYNTVRKIEEEGHIHRLEGMGKRCYALTEIEAYENKGLADPLSSRERQRLEWENQKLRKRVKELEGVIYEITSKACLFVAMDKGEAS